MKSIKIYLPVLFIIICNSLMGQIEKVTPTEKGSNFKENAAQRSVLQQTPLFKQLEHSTDGEKWAISVRPTFSRNHTSSEIQAIKDGKKEEKKASYSKAPLIEPKSVSLPVVGQNYEANWSLQACPPDNSMAVSNGGYVVSCNNDGAEYYNSSGTLLYSQYWYDVFNDPSLTAMLYDPKIIYDSQMDRFVMIVLHGSTGNTSQVVVCFSQTNNPMDGWWIYKLTGNPLNNDCWFDYPSLAVSTDEVFVSGNLFTTSGTFSEAVVYQIPKNPGFAGASLNWQYWNGLDNVPFTATTVVPAGNGQQGNYGPGMYFVSSQSSGNNKIMLWDITSNIAGSPQMNSYSINTTAYSPSADANQLGSTETLSNGDCRIQSAFYLNGIIHFTFHSDAGSGWNGLNYNRLNVGNGTNVSSIFGQPGNYDLSYPAVASFSTSSSDHSVMVAFLRSSPSIYPEVRVVNCDNNMTWSTSTLVKSGESAINFLNGNERWGDYTGISRRHNSASPKIWLAGCYGGDIPAAGATNTFKTWVAEIYGQNVPAELEEEQESDFVVYPVPTYDFINIRFTTETAEPLTIELKDVNGKIVKLLYKDTPKVGENKLIFNRGALAPGTYFVTIYSATKTFKNEKISVLN
ncbi:MAG: T9SS type A sorting domain-containing protein [Crocinitomicaceae bacterium]